MITRIARDTTLACIAIAVLFLLWKRDLTAPLGVLGGGLLIGISFWAIRGTVDALISLRSRSETDRISAVFLLVKFFTRHAILALAAYGMMARLELHPVGLLIGVSAPAVAAAFNALRART